MQTDPDLDRFVTAQDAVLAQVRQDLRAGRKQTHWMWFVFPQLAGLGHSPVARHYALRSLDEARAYLAHPVLAARLRECCSQLLAHRGTTALQILGSPDDLKLRSSMTLFAQADPAQPLYREVLQAFWSGEPDPRTLALLDR